MHHTHIMDHQYDLLRREAIQILKGWALILPPMAAITVAAIIIKRQKVDGSTPHFIGHGILALLFVPVPLIGAIAARLILRRCPRNSKGATYSLVALILSIAWIIPSLVIALVF